MSFLSMDATGYGILGFIDNRFVLPLLEEESHCWPRKLDGFIHRSDVIRSR